MSQQYPPGDPGHQGPAPEYLQSGQGSPIPPARDRPRRGRKGLLIGGGVAAALLVAGGAWAWTAFFAQGAQPSEALPDETLGYVAVDLDPTGQQKVEALEMLNKFPAFEDEIGLDTDDDIKQKLFESLQDDEGLCSSVDYAEDVEPWLGDRAAVAALDLGQEQPTPVVVVQVKDGDAAVDGIETLVECAGGEAPEGEQVGGYALDGDWVVLAETEQIANDVVEATGEGSLADDEDYQRWTGAAGDPGVMTMYAAPEAGEVLLELADAGMMGATSGGDETRKMFEEFPGAAGAVRFDDGALEVEFASGQLDSSLAEAFSTDRGDDTLATLPDSTAIAIGAGFDEGWAQEMFDYLRPMIEADSGMSLDEALAEAEAETGLDLPADLETLFGSSFAIALDSDFDPDVFNQGGPAGIPVGAKIEGEPEEIEAVVEKIRANMGSDAELLVSRAEGDHLVVGTNEGYLDKLAGDGGLGGTEIYEDVVPEGADSSSIFFVNFDAGDWLTKLAEFDSSGEAAKNVAPLEGFGASSWIDDGDAHVLFRLTTED